MNSVMVRLAIILLGSVLLVGCGLQGSPPAAAELPGREDSPLPGEGEFLQNFSKYLSFDAINPIYDPAFAAVDQASYSDDELVMGIAFEGQAKAYSVTVLRVREMVNDELAGIPVLVTW